MHQLRFMPRKNSYKRIPQVTSPRVFTYKELSTATGNFRTCRVIGRGQYGNIYSGKIVDQRIKIEIAVKNLSGGLQAKELQEWLAVVEDMGGIEHPNLVKLLGYHASDVIGGATRRFLVYEYMENKSIQDHLMMSFSTKFTWRRRLSIAQGAARGLSFLHDKEIVMRCFKPSVVLLDKEFNVKLSDYMLSKLGPFPYPSVELERRHRYFFGDSIVYASPQFVASGYLSSANDVWGFGVFLFELITGRRAIEISNQQSGRTLKLDWVEHDFSDINKFKLALDRSFGDEKHVLESAHALAAVAKMCLTEEIKKRPSMSEVLVMINKIVEALQPL